MTHQVKIDGLDSWIRMEAISRVREGENLEAAVERVGSALAQRVVDEISRQAGVIVTANAAQRR